MYISIQGYLHGTATSPRMRFLFCFLVAWLPVSTAWAQPTDNAGILQLVRQLARLGEPVPALPLKEARRTLPQVRQRFQQGLPAGTRLYVTAKVLNEVATPEPVLILVDTWQQGLISGRIVRLAAANSRSTSAVAPVELDETVVLDWTVIRPQGAEEGNYLGKFLDLEERLATLED
ncbi:hypothetical protein GCM10027348_29800 [Hymenobacter tenuis]